MVHLHPDMSNDFITMSFVKHYYYILHESSLQISAGPPFPEHQKLRKTTKTLHVLVLMTCAEIVEGLIKEYRQTSNISHTLFGNKIVDHSDVLGMLRTNKFCIGPQSFDNLLVQMSSKTENLILKAA